jgi:GTPase involved in cell partitioning and DNA repair
VDKALKKFGHGSLHEDLVSEYLINPLAALENDSNYKILEILEKLKKELTKGNIEIKEKQQQKILRNIDKIDKDYLKSIKKKQESLKKEKIKVNENLKKSTIMMDYKDLEYQMDHITEKIERLNEELADKKNILNNLQVGQKIKRLERALSEFTDYEVNIKQ